MSIKKPTETDLVRDCLQHLQLRRILAWRNNTQGVFDPRRGVFRKFTGRKGPGDILGVIPHLKDGRRGVFLSVECKMGRNKLSEDQLQFQADVLLAGGVALAVRSLADLARGLKEAGVEDGAGDFTFTSGPALAGGDDDPAADAAGFAGATTGRDAFAGAADGPGSA